MVLLLKTLDLEQQTFPTSPASHMEEQGEVFDKKTGMPGQDLRNCQGCPIIHGVAPGSKSREFSLIPSW